MKNQRLERRKMLQQAGLVGAGALAGLAPLTAQAEQGGDGHSIEGAWLIRVTPEGAPQSATYEVLNLYTMGGGVAGASARDPATGSSVYGAWTRSGGHQFQITFVGFTFDRASGEWTGRLKVQARATLSNENQAINGPARVSIYAPSGSLIAQVPTSFSGTRILVDSL
jgi:hypothetical protein